MAFGEILIGNPIIFCSEMASVSVYSPSRPLTRSRDLRFHGMFHSLSMPVLIIGCYPVMTSDTTCTSVRRDINGAPLIEEPGSAQDLMVARVCFLVMIEASASMYLACRIPRL